MLSSLRSPGRRRSVTGKGETGDLGNVTKRFALRLAGTGARLQAGKRPALERDFKLTNGRHWSETSSWQTAGTGARLHDLLRVGSARVVPYISISC